MAADSHAPVEALSHGVRRLVEEAQREAERRGYRAILSGPILLATLSDPGDIRDKLLLAIGTDEGKFREAFEAEWSVLGPVPTQDQPLAVVREAIFMVAEARVPPALATPEAYIAALLSFEDSMASRIIRRLGEDPAKVAEALVRAA